MRAPPAAAKLMDWVPAAYSNVRHGTDALSSGCCGASSEFCASCTLRATQLWCSGAPAAHSDGDGGVEGGLGDGGRLGGLGSGDGGRGGRLSVLGHHGRQHAMFWPCAHGSPESAVQTTVGGGEGDSTGGGDLRAGGKCGGAGVGGGTGGGGRDDGVGGSAGDGLMSTAPSEHAARQR